MKTSRIVSFTGLLITLQLTTAVVAKNRQVEPPSVVAPVVELVLTLPDHQFASEDRPAMVDQAMVLDEQPMLGERKSVRPVDLGCKVDLPNNIYVDGLDKRLQGNCDVSLRY